jgi:hypothetical protein
MAANPVFLDNTYNIRLTLEADRPSDGRRVPYTGRTITAWLSLTDGGTAIATLETTLSEIGTTGAYLGSLTAGTLRAAYTAGSLPLRPVWLVCGDGSTVKVSEKVPVYAVRRST